ncbi:hypothetical protein V8C86DRAFT_2688507 [Haematococcus lacustris]
MGTAARRGGKGVVVKSPLAWSTAAATCLSAAGVQQLLAPDSPHRLAWLDWLGGALAWLAGATVPLTLLSTGMWMHGRMALMASPEVLRQAIAYLVLKLAVLPWLMVAVTQWMGIGGRQGLALLLLTAVPVGQTAFVLSEQHQQGTEVITVTLIAGLLLLLPHLLCVLAVVQWLGLYAEQ